MHRVPVLQPLLVGLAAVLLLALGPVASAQAAEPPRVHHVLPENGAVLRAAPDHVEIMFDVLPAPGQVDVGVAPDATGRLLALPGPPRIDGPLLVQPLPPLPAGRYTVGVRMRGAAGEVAQGTFGFAVDPAADPAADPPPPSGPRSWVLPLVATALLAPAAALVIRRRRRAAGAACGPARAGRGTATPASSPAGRRGR